MIRSSTVKGVTHDRAEAEALLRSAGRSGPPALRVVSLFSGVGGLDLGLERAGAEIVEMCESWEPARRVLRERFAVADIADDVRNYMPEQSYDLLTAGFPCVDISHAGKQAGIFGSQSGLVADAFRIAAATKPEWILLENVPNLLRLGRGVGIRYIIDSLEQLGYSWAYRVLDSRAFGVPQRRNRVVVLASLHHDPANALLGENVEASSDSAPVPMQASGFYWTEGRRGVGLVPEAIPTLKGGSTLGLPSAPAIWVPSAPLGRRFVLPSIEDAEELQGFERGWTSVADVEGERSVRWKLTGNAVTVGLAHWVGTRIIAADEEVADRAGYSAAPFDDRRPWPDAAFGAPEQEIYAADVSRMPVQWRGKRLHEVINAETLQPLSYRATKGFLSRVEESGITLGEDFLKDLEAHMSSTRSLIDRKRPQSSREERSWASSDAVRKRMQATRQKNTTPELRLRRALTDQGLRYRLQIRTEPSLRWRSDIVFKGAKVVVDVRGCFWHVCPTHQTWPKSSAARWQEKLLANQERDHRMQAELAALGWLVIVVWEHEDAEQAAARIADIVAQRKLGRATTIRGEKVSAVA